MRGQGGEDASEHGEPAPAHEAIIERLVRAVARRSVLPLQPVANDADDAADDPPIVHPLEAALARKERFDLSHVSTRQQDQVGHEHLRTAQSHAARSRVKGRELRAPIARA